MKTLIRAWIAAILMGLGNRPGETTRTTAEKIDLIILK